MTETGERLAKRVAALVPCSRREAEQYIAGGWVRVDGRVVEEPQHRVQQQVVTLEGGEGSGKSTQGRLLAEALRADGHEVLLTREPGGTPGAEAIRGLLVTGDPDRWTPWSDALLMTAARVDHVARVIRPALERGATVICDRFIDSTRAYQGAGRGLEDAALIDLHNEAIGLWPDVTLVLLLGL